MTSVYELSVSGGLRLSDSAELPARVTTERGASRIRVVGPLLQEWEKVRALGLPDAVPQELCGGEVQSSVIIHGPALLLTLPIMTPGELRAQAFRMAYTSTTLITAEEKALPGIDRVLGERRNTSQRLTLPDLFVELIEASVSNVGPLYLSLRRQLEELADAIEDRPLEVPPGALLAIRRKVAQLSILLEDQIRGLMEVQLCRSHIPPSGGSHDLLRDLVSDGGRVLKLLAQKGDRLRDLRQHQLHCLQESTNILAILSAIYLPTTLIAGIYGMNFQYIPATRLKYGYFIVLAMMVALIVGQLWFFKRRGWFS